MPLRVELLIHYLERIGICLSFKVLMKYPNESDEGNGKYHREKSGMNERDLPVMPDASAQWSENRKKSYLPK